MITTNKYESPLGILTFACSEQALVGLWFNGQKYFGQTLPKETKMKEDAFTREVRHWLDVYFSGREPDFMPPMHYEATPFRQLVWEILRTISYGHTITYGEIAAQVAEKRGLARMSAQAVGGAVGHNPISLVIPCHRVVGTNGSLTGYGGGIQRKIQLLELEGVDMHAFFVPKKGTAL